MTNLVIVESPAKGRTIERFLGPDYKVLASFGHIKDLPKKDFGVEIDKDFKANYIMIPRAKKVVSFLRKASKDAKNVYLATDLDREGEAIAHHIRDALSLKLKTEKVKRITFTEITKNAIKNAITNPRTINQNLVEAQHARRVLDRMVGYKLSPFLWKKVVSGLSAGRVQSPALWLVVEREKEIQNFVPQEYWRIVAVLLKRQKSKDKSQEFEAMLFEKEGKEIDKLSIKKETDAKKILDDLKNAEYKVLEIQKSQRKIFPFAPFVTSTLQQEAFRGLGFSAKKTMFLAQSLYEKGLITYHRTDSTNLSNLALNSIRKYIRNNYGSKYLPKFARQYKTKVARAQEAHEAIRPTYIKSKIKNQKSKIEDEQERLYDLIFRRTVACQMSEAILDTQEVKIKAGRYGFKTFGQAINFDGFLKIYPMRIKESTLPPLSVSEILDLLKLNKEQHFTQPPKRYTEATLIKDLEKHGIGRPSTYAVILSTIKERGYVEKSRQYLFPQDIGFTVSDLLKKHFPDIVDLKFTAKMEDELDEVAEGKKRYEEVCRGFWGPFSQNLLKKEKELSKSEITEEKTDEICEKCGAKMVVKLGRYGKFLSCSKFPKCKNKKSYHKVFGQCPECKKGDIVERKTKKGKIFFGCSLFPKCKWATWDKPSEITEKRDKN